MAVEDMLDEIEVFESMPLDPRTQSWLDLENSRQEHERWKADDHRRRLSEQPRQEAEARRQEHAYEQAQLLALIPRADWESEEFAPTEGELAQRSKDADELRRLSQRLAYESRERELRYLMYDRHVDRKQAEAWWAFEHCEGPRPESAVETGIQFTDEDPMLDTIAYDADVNETIIRGSARPTPSTREATHVASAQPTQVSLRPQVNSRCSVCGSGQAEAINAALAAGASMRRIATEYQLSEAAIRRHVRHASRA